LNEKQLKDIAVTVQETHTGSLLFGVGVNSDAGLTGSIVPPAEKEAEKERKLAKK
jgi:outer membrane protein assembly factor BamA